MVNPTKPGIHNHLHRPVRPHDPANPRPAIDRVFGDEAPIIEGLPIEVGSGAPPAEAQLAQHVLHVHKRDGAAAARALIEKLCKAQINQRAFREQLEAYGLARPISKTACRQFDELQPNGSPN